MQKPISAIVFGILNIGYGIFGLLSLVIVLVVAGAKMGPNSPFKALAANPDQMQLMWITGAVSAVAGVFLAVMGMGLLLCKNWGRVGSLAWAVFDILFVFVCLPLSYKTARASSPAQFGDSFAMLVTIFGLFFSLAYPAVLAIFMVRPKLVEACNARRA
jgi:hypothetical protein